VLLWISYGHCYAVARMFAMWLLGYCYVVAGVLWVVAMVLVRHSGWLLGCCNVVAKVIWVVASVLLCGC